MDGQTDRRTDGRDVRTDGRDIPLSRDRSVVVQVEADNARLTASRSSTEVEVHNSSTARRRSTVMTAAITHKQ